MRTAQIRGLRGKQKLNGACKVNIASVWGFVQFALGKLWDVVMLRWLRPKSAQEQLAELELRDRQIQNKVPDYMQQISFAYSALAKDHPAANVMSLSVLAKAIDCDPESAIDIVRVLVKQEHLKPVRGINGETQYMLTNPAIQPRPRVYRL
jgi:hypothetical protein